MLFNKSRTNDYILMNPSSYYISTRNNFFILKSIIYKRCNPCVPETFLLFLKQLDVPFYETIWLTYLKNSIKNNHDLKHIFGKYLSCMNLRGYKSHTWKDSQYNKNIVRYDIQIEGINTAGEKEQPSDVF